MTTLLDCAIDTRPSTLPLRSEPVAGWYQVTAPPHDCTDVMHADGRMLTACELPDCPIREQLHAEGYDRPFTGEEWAAVMTSERAHLRDRLALSLLLDGLSPRQVAGLRRSDFRHNPGGVLVVRARSAAATNPRDLQGRQLADLHSYITRARKVYVPVSAMTRALLARHLRTSPHHSERVPGSSHSRRRIHRNPWLLLTFRTGKPLTAAQVARAVEQLDWYADWRSECAAAVMASPGGIGEDGAVTDREVLYVVSAHRAALTYDAGGPLCDQPAPPQPFGGIGHAIEAARTGAASRPVFRLAS